MFSFKNIRYSQTCTTGVLACYACSHLEKEPCHAGANLYGWIFWMMMASLSQGGRASAESGRTEFRDLEALVKQSVMRMAILWSPLDPDRTKSLAWGAWNQTAVCSDVCKSKCKAAESFRHVPFSPPPWSFNTL